jgi:hypothetical protein
MSPFLGEAPVILLSSAEMTALVWSVYVPQA